MKAKLKPSNVNPAPVAQCLTFGTHSLCILLVPKSVGTPTSPVPPFIPHSLACRLRLAPLPTYGCPWKVSHSSGLSKHLGSPLQMRYLHQGSPLPSFQGLSPATQWQASSFFLFPSIQQLSCLQKPGPSGWLGDTAEFGCQLRCSFGSLLPQFCVLTLRK